MLISEYEVSGRLIFVDTMFHACLELTISAHVISGEKNYTRIIFYKNRQKMSESKLESCTASVVEVKPMHIR